MHFHYFRSIDGKEKIDAQIQNTVKEFACDYLDYDFIQREKICSLHRERERERMNA